MKTKSEQDTNQIKAYVLVSSPLILV